MFAEIYSKVKASTIATQLAALVAAAASTGVHVPGHSPARVAAVVATSGTVINILQFLAAYFTKETAPILAKLNAAWPGLEHGLADVTQIATVAAPLLPKSIAADVAKIEPAVQTGDAVIQRVMAELEGLKRTVAAGAGASTTATVADPNFVQPLTVTATVLPTATPLPHVPGPTA